MNLLALVRRMTIWSKSTYTVAILVNTFRDGSVTDIERSSIPICMEGISRFQCMDMLKKYKLRWNQKCVELGSTTV